MGLSSLFPPVLIFAFSLCFILKQNLFGPCYPFFCIFGVLSCLASFSFPLISFDLNSPPHLKVSSLLFILKQYLHDLCHPFFWIFFLSSCLLNPFLFYAYCFSFSLTFFSFFTFPQFTHDSLFDSPFPFSSVPLSSCHFCLFFSWKISFEYRFWKNFGEISFCNTALN